MYYKLLAEYYYTAECEQAPTASGTHAECRFLRNSIPEELREGLDIRTFRCKVPTTICIERRTDAILGLNDDKPLPLCRQYMKLLYLGRKT